MNKTILITILLVFLVLVLFVTNLFCGAVSLEATQVMDALLGKTNDVTSYIVVGTRLPQAFTALLCGAALAVSGLLLQTTFSNPLADPSILGVNAGASLGVAIAMLLFGGSVGLGSFSLSGFALTLFSAFIGAIAVIGLLLFFSTLLRSSLMLLIIGIIVGYLTSSIISLLNFSATAQGLQSYVIWGMGNFSGVSTNQMPAFALVVIVGLVLSLLLVKPLNALLLGENYAANLGVNTRRVRTLILLVTGLLTAVTTAFCGPISFIGLAVPHIIRLLLRTSNHRVLMPLTLLMGSCVALLCNILCTLPTDGVLPLSVVTPLIGVPVVLYVMLFRRGSGIN
ncbi:MAG: iron ABC transporter permease [Bacteroidaceae bacterium]